MGVDADRLIMRIVLDLITFSDSKFTRPSLRTGLNSYQIIDHCAASDIDSVLPDAAAQSKVISSSVGARFQRGMVGSAAGGRGFSFFEMGLSTNRCNR